MQIIDRIVCRGGPPRGRTSPDGRRPPAGRLARQRDHSAAGARRAGRCRFAASACAAAMRATCSASRRLTPEMADDLLEACVKARLNILISGGTGSGKTTLLNIAVQLHPERRAHRDHRGRGRTAAAAGARGAAGDPAAEHRGQGRGHAAATGAQRPAHAARPHHHRRVRGAEALDMLQAMNTGHEGSMTTIHANTPRDALARLETMVAHGRHEPAGEGGAPADRLGARRDASSSRGSPTARARSTQHPRDHRHGRRASSRCRRSSRSSSGRGRATATVIGDFRATGIRPALR